MTAEPRDGRVLGDAPSAEVFLSGSWQKKADVLTLVAAAAASVRASFDGLTVAVLLGRAGRRGGLSLLGSASQTPPDFLGAGATRMYEEGKPIEARGAHRDDEAVARLARGLWRELESPVQSVSSSVLAIPAAAEPLDVVAQADWFVLHVRGAPCRLTVADVEVTLSDDDKLVYVPYGANLRVEAEGETLLLRVGFELEPAWRVLALVIADRLSSFATAGDPLPGLLGAPGGARSRLNEVFDAFKAQLATWTIDELVRDYAAIERGTHEADVTADVVVAPTLTMRGPEEDAASQTATPDESESTERASPSVTAMYEDQEWGIEGIARRTDDIHVVTYKRSGTTWTQMIMYQLLTDGDLDAIAHMYEFSPYAFYELRILGTTERIDALPSPRVFKVHLPADLGYSPVGRFIYVAREGMDVAVSSFFHHMEVGNGPIPFDVHFDRFISEARWFKDVASWWARREEPNVLFLTYRELKTNPRDAIARIARFCEIPLTEERLARVEERSSFAYMKAREAKFDHTAGIEWLYSKRTKAGFIRKGTLSQGAAKLSEQQRRRFAAAYERYLGMTGLELDV